MSLLLDLIFPVTCVGCRHSGHYLCPDCAARLTPKSLSPPNPGSVLEGRLSLFSYKNEIRQLIQLLKYQYVSDAGHDIGRTMAAIIKENYPNLLKHWQSHGYVLAPIPLHPLRQNWRGFNQSQIFCQEISTSLHLVCQPNILIRSRYTSPQAKQLQKSDRQSHLLGAFSLSPRFTGHLPDNIILVDDVYTTGSTLESAALVLRHFGCGSIIGVTLAG